jgi:hypothetical protein
VSRQWWTTAPGASSPTMTKRGLSCTIRDGESNEMKRRKRGTHLGVRNRGRGVVEGDRGGGAVQERERGRGTGG